MKDEQFEITGVSKHDQCFSKAMQDTYGAECKCAFDTVEGRSLKDGSMRNWQFPKGRIPFAVGQVVSSSDMDYARTHGFMAVHEEIRQSKKQEESEQKGQ